MSDPKSPLPEEQEAQINGLGAITFIKRVTRWVPNDGTVYVISAWAGPGPDFIVASHEEITTEDAILAINNWYAKLEERENAIV